MQTNTVTFLNEEGMHLRPAQKLVDAAVQFESDIVLKTEDGRETNAKSVVGILTMAIEQGAKVTLTTDGSDEEQAIEKLSKLFEQGFGE